MKMRVRMMARNNNNNNKEPAAGRVCSSLLSVGRVLSSWIDCSLFLFHVYHHSKK